MVNVKTIRIFHHYIMKYCAPFLYELVQYLPNLFFPFTPKFYIYYFPFEGMILIVKIYPRSYS